MTSFRVVSSVRKVLSCRKAGHTGTLDPSAIGVLPVCLGRATKIMPYISDETKEYIADITLGIKTNTLDTDGEILEENDNWADIETEVINNVLNMFLGDIDQIPPMFSAIHHNGRRLYELARKGKEVERQPRKVEIKEIELLGIELPVIKIRILCSKGTYIRTLADDIGKQLGVGACLSSLTRSKAGKFCIENSVSLEELEEKQEECIMPVDYPLDYPKFSVVEDKLKLAQNGAALEPGDISNPSDEEIINLDHDSKVLLYYQNLFISINKIDKSEDTVLIKPLRVFNVKI